MELTQPEIIQLLRRRCNMNQGALGSAAFETSIESGRTKIKNIELGRQIPTPDDLERMARVLGVSATDLDPARVKAPAVGGERAEGVFIRRRVLELLPGADVYLEMLNKAVRLEDRELIAHIGGKLAGLFADLAQGSRSATSRSA